MIKKIPKKNYQLDQQKALAEANDWFTKINGSSLTAKTKEEFHAWLAESPTHKKKLDLVLAIWNRTDILINDPFFIKELKENTDKERTFPKRKWIEKLTGSFPFFKSVVVAATIILLVTGIWFMQRDVTVNKTYYTITGEQKEVFLSDGSPVLLDTKTTIITSFTNDLRQIELIEGRASFSVVRDTNRPFFVNAGRVSIRALGTVFNVYKRNNEDVSVTVTEGSVRVFQKEELHSQDTDKSPDIPKIGKMPVEDRTDEKAIIQHVAQIQEVIVSGQEVTINDKERLCEITPVDVAQENAWRNGKLHFYKKPLKEVIAEINRYLDLDQRIIIDDEHLKDFRITLSFYIKHRNDFLNTLKEAMPIKSRTTLNGQIIITKEFQKI